MKEEVLVLAETLVLVVKASEAYGEAGDFSDKYWLLVPRHLTSS